MPHNEGTNSEGDTEMATAKMTADEIRADRAAAEESDGMCCGYCDQYIGFSESYKTVNGIDYHKSCARLAR